MKQPMFDNDIARRHSLLPQIDGNFGKELMAIKDQKIKAFVKEIRADEREKCAMAAFLVGADLGYDLSTRKAVESNAGHYEVDQSTGDTEFVWGCNDG